MAILGIFNEAPEEWIDFSDDTEILIRHLDKKALQAISAKSEKAARLSGSDSSSVFNRILAEKSVLGWRNKFNYEHPGIVLKRYKGDPGQPFPFSPENRQFLMENSIEFSSFINNTCTNSRLFLEEDGDDSKNA